MKLVIDHLQKKYGDKEVLRDISFSFESGKIYGLLGRNGAGKTTLFNCLNRDITCDGGSFIWRQRKALGKSPRRTSAMSSPPRLYRNF